VTEEIRNTVKDLVTGFVFYDRKEDEDLSVEDLNKSINTGETTVKEIVSVFEQALKATYPEK